MRICYLAHAGSIHTQKWVRSFVELGHDVHLITFEYTPIKGATVHEIQLPLLVRNGSFAFKLAAIHLIKRLLKKINPDVLHAHFVTNYGLFGALIGFHPFVLTAWGSDLNTATQSWITTKIKNPLATYALRKADLITTDARHMKNKIIQYGVEPEKIRLICFGVDIDLFKPNGFKPERPTVISMRGLERQYNIKTLLKAFRQVLTELDAHLVIAGDGPERNRLASYARNIGVAGHVTFSGQIPNNMLPEWLCSSSVYVSTSLSDAGISASTAEAMACELPVVVSDVGENREWLDETCLFPSYDAETLANKIVYFLTHPRESRLFGLKNRITIMERNDIHAEMAKMEKLYERVVKNG